MDALEYYIEAFSHLHTAKIRGRKAPHKAVLLISIMDLVSMGAIDSTEIELTDDLVNTFKFWWEFYAKSIHGFTPDIGKPFYHMQHESFWQLSERTATIIEGMAAESLSLRNKEKVSYAVNALRNKYSCALIDFKLLELMKDKETCKILRQVLVKNYLSDDSYDSTPSLPTFIGIASILMTLAA